MGIAGFEKIVIVGVGLIGGSLAGALKAHDKGIEVYGVDSDADAIRIALKRGYLDAGIHMPTREGDELPEDREDEQSLGDLIASGDIDLVVLAVPVDQSGFWFDLLADLGYRGVVTDVGSTKAPVIKAAGETLLRQDYFVPGHPMAGSEVSGIEGARADLFEGAYWILAPNADTDAHVFRRLHSLFTALGARVIVVDPEEHDQAVAIVSHVPHIAASSLVALAGRHAGKGGELLRLAAGGFKDTTRVAAGSPDLWTGICLDNAEALSEGLKEYSNVILSFERMIREKDTESLKELLTDAADIRRSLPAKWVPQSTQLTEVRIPMGDRSGVIAEITAVAGRTGCNIQAIEIDHQTEDTAILELILTDEGDVDGFIDTLERSGFSPKTQVLGES